MSISIMYEDTTAKVIIIIDRETETFNILAGVLQGDKLAPYIFVNTSKLGPLLKKIRTSLK